MVHPVNGEVPPVKGRPRKLPHYANRGKTSSSGGELASARSCFSTVRTALGKLRITGLLAQFDIARSFPQFPRPLLLQPTILTSERGTRFGIRKAPNHVPPPHLPDDPEICIPWHYLFERSIFVHEKREFIEADYDDTVQSVAVRHTLAPIPPEGGEREPAGRSGLNAPTVDDLNEDTGRQFDRIGVAETTANDLERLLAETDQGWRIAQHDQERLHDRGICRMIVMDVRNERGSL